MMTWMLCTVAFGSLVSASARLVESALPPARSRRQIWIAAALMTVLVPTVVLLTGGRLPGSVFGPRQAIELPAVIATWSGDVGAMAIELEGAAPAVDVAWLLASAWLVMSLVLLAGYAAIWLRFIGSASEWRGGRVHGQSVRVAARMGPAVFGLWRPIIVVPEWVLDADPVVQRLIVLHEVEHTRAHDHVLLALAPLALIAMPWNLPLWWQVHRLRLATELDCDRRVLSHGVRPHDYGTLLIDIAGRTDPMPSALAALGGPRTSLERRILAMSTRTPSHWRSRAAVLTAAAALLLVTALETFAVMAPAGVVRILPDAAAAGPVEAGPAIPSGALTLAADTPIVVVDGVIVRDGDIEKTVAGATIASIEMVRGAEAIRRFGEHAAAGVLLITTAPGAPARRGVTNPAAVQSWTAAEAAAVRAERTAVELRAAARADGPAVTDAPLIRTDGVSIRAVAVPTEGAEVRRLRVTAAGAGSPEPLYVVDGVLSTSALDIDPDRIESIEVVKGAAAEKLYGERAAGGVIRITTKK